MNNDVISYAPHRQPPQNRGLVANADRPYKPAQPYPAITQPTGNY